MDEILRVAASLPTPVQVTIIALIGPVFGALVAFCASVGGAWLASIWTREREDRSRALQQKREVCVGALQAFRNLVVAMGDAERYKAAARDSVQSLLDVRRRVLVERDRLEDFRRDVDDAGEKDTERIIAELGELERELRTESGEKVDKSREHESLRDAAFQDVAYWTTMLGFTVETEVVTAFVALCNAPAETRMEAEKVYEQAVREELRREPKVKTWRQVFSERLRLGPG